MFNISSTEIAFIAVVALLVLGPKKLPELARGIGKFMRDFRQKTSEVRNVVEREFYRMDQDVLGAETPKIAAADGSVAASPGDDEHHEDWKPDPSALPPGQAAAAAPAAAQEGAAAAAPAEPQLEQAAEDYGDGLSPHDEGEPPPEETPPVTSPAMDSQLTAGMPKAEPAPEAAPVDPSGAKG